MAVRCAWLLLLPTVFASANLPITLTVDGRTRHAILHLPPPPPPSTGAASASAEQLPLVFNWHAMMEDMGQQQGLSDLDRVADLHRFAVVYPQGFAEASVLSYKLGGYTHNGGGCCSAADSEGIDDVAFARALLEHVAAAGQNNNDTRRSSSKSAASTASTAAPIAPPSLPSAAAAPWWGIDRRRIYATGFSNGGFMVNRLACEASELFAAVASVSGILAPRNNPVMDPNGTAGNFTCTPGRPVPVLHVHGTEDPLVDYNGNPFMGWDGVVNFTEAWAARNGCHEPPVTVFANSTNNTGDTTNGNGTTNGNADTTKFTGDTTNGNASPSTPPASPSSVHCVSRCGGMQNVTLCTITGGKHAWPGGRCGGSLGPCALHLGPLGTLTIASPALIHTADEIWRFFSAASMPAADEAASGRRVGGEEGVEAERKDTPSLAPPSPPSSALVAVSLSTGDRCLRPVAGTPVVGGAAVDMEDSHAKSDWNMDMDTGALSAITTQRGVDDGAGAVADTGGLSAAVRLCLAAVTCEENAGLVLREVAYSEADTDANDYADGCMVFRAGKLQSPLCGMWCVDPEGYEHTAVLSRCSTGGASSFRANRTPGADRDSPVSGDATNATRGRPRRSNGTSTPSCSTGIGAEVPWIDCRFQSAPGYGPLPPTSVRFTTSDAPTAALFAHAETCEASNTLELAPGFEVLVEGGGYKAVWLETQPMGGATYGVRNLTLALNNQLVFMRTQREDGRLPGMVTRAKGAKGAQPSASGIVHPTYSYPGNANRSMLQGFYMASPAVDVAWLMNRSLADESPTPTSSSYSSLSPKAVASRTSTKAYLVELASVLVKFERWLWAARNSTHGVLWLPGTADTGEDGSDKCVMDNEMEERKQREKERKKERKGTDMIYV
jgi:polyhydroxybutyrate depolymerase